jgi:TrpR family trp operon transcriptional repressor
MTNKKKSGKLGHTVYTNADAEALNELAAVFASVRAPDAMARLFGDMLTHAELHDLILRWRLLKMLDAGVSQRQIAETLGISLCKITRGSRVLKQPDALITTLLRQRTSSKGN